MIVHIAVPPPDAMAPKLVPLIAALGHDELFLIELQGVLDVQCPESAAKDGQLIGTLNTADMSRPTLVIGHHLLEGKVVRLPKPLGVLHKRVRDSPAGGGDRAVRWDVAAVVTKKMVFSKRPMPIAKAQAKPASVAGGRR